MLRKADEMHLKIDVNDEIEEEDEEEEGDKEEDEESVAALRDSVITI